MQAISYIALGSNLDKPGLQLQRAVDDIDSTSGMTLTGCFPPLFERSLRSSRTTGLLQCCSEDKYHS